MQQRRQQRRQRRTAEKIMIAEDSEVRSSRMTSLVVAATHACGAATRRSCHMACAGSTAGLPHPRLEHVVETYVHGSAELVASSVQGP